MQGNIRGLLGSLQTVLWDDSGWTPVSVGDLLEPAQIRKVWMKANLLVHPDKVGSGLSTSVCLQWLAGMLNVVHLAGPAAQWASRAGGSGRHGL